MLVRSSDLNVSSTPQDECYIQNYFTWCARQNKNKQKIISHHFKTQVLKSQVKGEITVLNTTQATTVKLKNNNNKKRLIYEGASTTTDRTLELAHNDYALRGSLAASRV